MSGGHQLGMVLSEHGPRSPSHFVTIQPMITKAMIAVDAMSLAPTPSCRPALPDPCGLSNAVSE